MKSPLRYPGGKNKAIKILQEIINKYYPKPKKLLSPFCGGCSFELSFENLEHTILCDKFKPLIIFWSEIKNNPEDLIYGLNFELECGITSEDFKNYREELLKLNSKQTLTKEERTELATYYFVINRCSFSGSTLSGGFSKQSSKERFTQSSIDKIAELVNSKHLLDKIEFICSDFVNSLSNVPEDYFIFCDPPYCLEKSKLYGIDGDLHENFDHVKFHDTITKLNNNYIITYNDSPFIRNLYEGHVIISAEWSYGMNKTKNSSEIIILSKLTSEISKGSIPHLVGKSFEIKVRNYMLNLGFDVDKETAGSSSLPDITIKYEGKTYFIECKTKIVGVDYKQFKLDYIDNKWKYENEYCNELINKYMPINLFNNENLPEKISSVDWNTLKKNENKFKDIVVNIELNDLSTILPNIHYIAFQDYGLYKIHDTDPLNFNPPKFTSTGFQLRFYVKNHSSAKAENANLSVVATLRICRKSTVKQSDIFIN